MSDIEEFDIDYDIDVDDFTDDYINHEQIDNLITNELNINKSKHNEGGKKIKKVSIKEDNEKENEKKEEEYDDDNDNDDEEYDDENDNSTDLNELENDDDIEIVPSNLNFSNKEFIIHPQNRISSEYLSRYEYSKVIGIRAEEISQGGIIYVDIKNLNDPIEMAKKEMNANMCPLSIKRHIGLNKSEIWSVNELIKKNYN